MWWKEKTSDNEFLNGSHIFAKKKKEKKITVI